MKAIFFILSIIFAILIAGECHSLPKISSFRERVEEPLASDRRAFIAKSEGSTAAIHHKVPLIGLIINIVADLCPHGILPLAFGLSRGGPTGIIPAISLVILFGIMSGYSMTSYASMAEDMQANTIGELWSAIIGRKSKIFADMSVFSLCFGCCIFYSAFMGDIFAALASSFGVRGPLGSRWTILGLLSSTVILPLCLLEDLSALQFSSKLGVVCIAFTVFVHIKRLLDGSYKPGSEIFSSLLATQRPSFPTPKFNYFSLNTGVLTLVNMLCVAYLAHYNAINYYKELDQKSPVRYKTAIFLGYGISLAIFLVMMFAGFSLFGLTSQPLLLNNFSRTHDFLATLARISTGFAITFAYPLMFAGLKSALKNLLVDNAVTDKLNKDPSAVDPIIYRGSQVATLSIITMIAFQYSEADVSVILGIVGSVLGCGVAYVIPGYLKLAYYRKKRAQGQAVSRIDAIANHWLVGLGLFFGVLGVIVTINDASAHHH